MTVLMPQKGISNSKGRSTWIGEHLLTLKWKGFTMTCIHWNNVGPRGPSSIEIENDKIISTNTRVKGEGSSKVF